MGGSGSTGGSGGSAAIGGNSTTGIWDLIGSVKTTGTLVKGTLEIAPEKLVLVIDGTTLSYQAGPPASLTFVRPFASQNKSYVVTRTPSYVPLGLIPLDLGGSWSFTDPVGGGSCTAALSANGFSGSCSNVTGAPLALPSLNASLTANRGAPAASDFGELGGSWTAQSNGGGEGHCSASFAINEFTASCSATGTPLDGTLSFTLGAGIGSGSSNYGLEISAVRR
jgi:hypothetical protein